MTRYLTVKEVLEVHRLEVGAPLIDRHKIESAVAQPEATWEGVPLYQSVYKQAAVLMHGISQAHAFYDGNKRAAFLSGQSFLDLNGIGISLLPVDPHPCAVCLMRLVAKRKYGCEDVENWLIDHSV